MKLISKMLFVVLVVGCTMIPGTRKNINVIDLINKNNSVSSSEVLITEEFEVVLELNEIVEEDIVTLTNEEIAEAVIRGEYGNGSDRVAKIELMG